jgi:hypothetical protein
LTRLLVANQAGERTPTVLVSVVLTAQTLVEVKS